MNIQVTGAFSQRDNGFLLVCVPYFEISNGSCLLLALSLVLLNVALSLCRHKRAVFATVLVLYYRCFKSQIQYPARFSVLPGGNGLFPGLWNPKFPPGGSEILVGPRPLRTGFRYLFSDGHSKVVWLC